jgi:NAD-dependent DNA ligase
MHDHAVVAFKPSGEWARSVAGITELFHITQHATWQAALRYPRAFAHTPVREVAMAASRTGQPGGPVPAR